MLLLITGAPGASKTSHVIDKFMEEKKRPIFYYNIQINEEGQRSLGWVEYTKEQVQNWDEELPPNAILIVDEAQQVWPVRSPSKPVPPGCSAMETHRHKGVDIVLITQHPGLLDSHIRKLVNEHYHYSRPFGMPFAVQYHSGSGVVSPDNRTDLAQCTQSKKQLPKRVWPLYKSAEVHTHKAKIPKVVWFVIVMGILAVFLIYKFLQDFGPGPDQGDIEQIRQANGGFASAPAPEKPATETMSWPELLKPEIPGLPYTAPLYREQASKPLDVPRVAGCIAFQDDDCACYTQQGTRIHDMSQQACLRHLKSPTFDHLREPNRIAQSDTERERARARGEARARAVLLPATGTY